jgi:competence protein ComEC
MAGIALAECLGPSAATLHTALRLVPAFVATTIILAFAWPRLAALPRPTVRLPRQFPPGWLLSGLLALAALAVGFTRHHAMLARPADHVIHVLAAEPLLTRVTGRIVTTPILRPAQKRNPFLVFTPQPRTQFILDLDALRPSDTAPPMPLRGHVRVSVDGPVSGLILGTRVQITGRLFRPFGPHNPGETDWSRWYRAEGIDAGLSVDGPEHVQTQPDRPQLRHRLITWLRTRARGLLFEPYADYESDSCTRLLDTMVLGQRSAADQQINDAFLRAGGMHFLAVSGFNVNLLAVSAWWTLRRILRQGRVVASLGALACIILFALVTEMNAPVLRATVAGALVCLAALARRPLALLNWLALAAAVVLLCNPNELFRAGFQLSFLQVLCLLTIVPRDLRDLLGRTDDDETPHEAGTPWALVRLALARGAVALTLACLAAWLISLPLVWWHFGRLAPWGWLGSLVLTPLVTFITVLSFVTALLNLIVPPAGAVTSTLLHAATGLLLCSVRLFAYLPAALVEVRPPPLWLVLASYVALLGGIAWRLRPPPRDVSARIPERRARLRRWRELPLVRYGAILGAVAILWLAWGLLRPPARGSGYTLHVLAVGNGAAVVLTTPSGAAAILDAGTDLNADVGEIVAVALRALDVGRVQDVLISHGNTDHYSGLPELLRSHPQARWYTNPAFARPDDNTALSELRAACPGAVPPPRALAAGDRIEVGGALLEVLWPPADVAGLVRANDHSLVVRVAAEGRSVLLTGDIERAALEGLVEADRAGRLRVHADVLVAPHHGSVIPGATADFLAAVVPQCVLVSTRTPRPKLLAVVRETLGPGARVLATDDVGAVTVRIEPGGTLTVETPLAR